MRQALAEQARLGILGVTPEEAIEHSRRYEAVIASGAAVLDLGSGGGIPGLVVAWDRPDVRMTLLDVRRKRTDQLERLVRRLGLRERVTVVCDRAERVAGAFDLVIARKFGRPAEVAAVADRLVRDGGLLVVSAAPDDRWDAVASWRPSSVDSPAGLLVLERARPA